MHHHLPLPPTFPPTSSLRKRSREFPFQDHGDINWNRSCSRRSVFSHRSYPPNNECRRSSATTISDPPFDLPKPNVSNTHSKHPRLQASQISPHICTPERQSTFVPRIHQHRVRPPIECTTSKAFSSSVATNQNGTAICNLYTRSAKKQSYLEVHPGRSKDQPTSTSEIAAMPCVEAGHSQAMPEEKTTTEQCKDGSHEGNMENDHTIKSWQQQEDFCEVPGREILDSLDLGDISHLEEDFKVLITEQTQDQYCGSIFDDELELGSSAMVTPIPDTSKPTEDSPIDVVIPPSGGSGLIASDSANSILGKTTKPSRVSEQIQQPDGKHRDRDRGEKDERPPVKDFSHKFKLHGRPALKEIQYETDAYRISQRQRQIQFGKNTLGYERYIGLVPRHKRKKSDPHTPEVRQACSKRSWDGQIKKWRRLLHFYDPPMEEGDEMPTDFSKKFEPDDSSNEAKLPDDSQATEVQPKIDSSIYGDWDETEI